jgi:hypothetical protein
MKQRIVGGIGAILVALTLASGHVAAQFGGPPPPGAAAMKEAASRPTPKRPNGVPDFTGIWAQTRSRADNIAALDTATGSYKNVLQGRTGNPVDFERDSGVSQRVIPRAARPWYKPQYWERVQFNDVHGHSPKAPDPEFLCMPPGVPRIGIPQEIVQTDSHMIFTYPLHLRRVYIDGRDHPPEEQWLGTWLGHSVGRWEGDTLVISTVDFNGQEEPLPCVERDLQHIVTRERG